ncbi:MAG: hypothetical protein MUF38_01445 [Anaerolineae bacterium]|jgi:hypothetical protein|nr:hypothetical protein [Anaerolineae bacterium]
MLLHLKSRLKSNVFKVYIVALFIMSMSAVAFAQTPVPIIVDTNQIFTSTNNWITTFIPIMSIGLGIGIALAILTFIGREILKAFRGGGR